MLYGGCFGRTLPKPLGYRFEMTEIQLYANIAIFAGFLSLRVQNTKRLAIMLGAVFTSNIAYFYLVCGRLGYDLNSLTYHVHGGSFPFYLLIPIYAGLLALGLWRLPVRKWRLLVGLAVATWIYVPGAYGDIVELSNMSSSDAEVTVLATGSITALLLSVLAPMLLLSDGETCLAKRLFWASWGHLKKHGVTLIAGLAAFIVIYYIFNLIIKGELLSPHIAITPSILIRHILYTVFYFVLIEQFVAIGLAKRVLDHFTPGEGTSIHEMWLYALLLALLNYQWPALYMAREFMFGLVVSYWYIKTGSLTYGILVRSAFLAFL